MKVCVYGILAVVILETIALIKGVDGIMFGSAMGAIGAMVGYWIALLKIKYKKGGCGDA